MLWIILLVMCFVILKLIVSLGQDLIKLAVMVIPIILILAGLGFVLQKLGCGKTPPTEPPAQVELAEVKEPITPVKIVEPIEPFPFTASEVESMKMTEKSLGRKFSEYPYEYLDMVEKNNALVDILLDAVKTYGNHNLTEDARTKWTKTMEDFRVIHSKWVLLLKEYEPPRNPQVIRPRN